MPTRVQFIAKGETDGALYCHVFKSVFDGSTMEVECSFEEYMALREKDAKPVTPPVGYTWEQSYGTHRFDTPSGKLEDGCISEDETRYHLNLGGKYMSFPKEMFDRLKTVHIDKVEDKGVTRIYAFPVEVEDGRTVDFPVDDKAIEAVNELLESEK